MTAIVTQSLIDRTWQQVGGSSAPELQRMQRRLIAEQDAIFAFVMACIDELRPDAIGIALYLLVVIEEAFCRSGVKLRRVKPGKLMRAWDASSRLIDTLKTLDRHLSHHAADARQEPAVFRYLVDALNQVDDEEGVSLSDEEFWHLLGVLQAVADCLHEARKK